MNLKFKITCLSFLLMQFISCSENENIAIAENPIADFSIED